MPEMDRFGWGTIAIAIVLFICAWIVPSVSLFTFPINSKIFTLEKLLLLLWPAVVASLFIERAVEAIVVGWRKLGREHIEWRIDQIGKKIDKAKTLDAQIPGKQDELDTLANELHKHEYFRDNYKRHTVEMAFGFILFFSFTVSAFGIRLITPFFDIPYLDCITGLEIEPEECPSGYLNAKAHYEWLVRMDVLVSSFIIAGGSTGLHSIVDAITSFAEKTKNNNNV